MTAHKDRNFSFADPPCENDDTFDLCNLSQLQPNTVICEGKTGLTFTQCNLVNCSVPISSAVAGGNIAQISRCAHLHPEWPLPAEVDNCPHVTSTDEIWVDGVLIETVYHRQDTVQ